MFFNDKDAYLTWGVTLGDNALNELIMPPPVKDWITNKNSRDPGAQVYIGQSATVDERTFVMNFHIFKIATSPSLTAQLDEFLDELQWRMVTLVFRNTGEEWQKKVYRLMYLSSQSYKTGPSQSSAKLAVKFLEPDPTNRAPVPATMYDVDVRGSSSDGRADLAFANITGGGRFAQGAECTASATMNPGYRLIQWWWNNAVASTKNPYTFNVFRSGILVAMAEPTSTPIVFRISDADIARLASLKFPDNFFLGTDNFWHAHFQVFSSIDGKTTTPPDLQFIGEFYPYGVFLTRIDNIGEYVMNIFIDDADEKPDIRSFDIQLTQNETKRVLTLPTEIRKTN